MGPTGPLWASCWAPWTLRSGIAYFIYLQSLYDQNTSTYDKNSVTCWMNVNSLILLMGPICIVGQENNLVTCHKSLEMSRCYIMQLTSLNHSLIQAPNINLTCLQSPGIQKTLVVSKGWIFMCIVLWSITHLCAKFWWMLVELISISKIRTQ